MPSEQLRRTQFGKVATAFRRIRSSLRLERPADYRSSHGSFAGDGTVALNSTRSSRPSQNDLEKCIKILNETGYKSRIRPQATTPGPKYVNDDQMLWPRIRNVTDVTVTKTWTGSSNVNSGRIHDPGPTAALQSNSIDSTSNSLPFVRAFRPVLAAADPLHAVRRSHSGRGT